MYFYKFIFIHLFIIVFILVLSGCNKGKGSMSIPYQKEIEQISKNLEEKLNGDGIAQLQDYRGEEKYRFIWSGGWVSTIYFTIAQENNTYSLFLEGYSPLLKKYQKQGIELEEYEWLEIQKQLNKIDFWNHPPSIIEEEMNEGADGTWYTLEGLRGNQYHIIYWPYAENKEKLISLFIKFARLESIKPVVKKNIKSDSVFYEISLDNLMNTADLKLVTDNQDTINSNGYLIQLGLPIKDSSKIYDFQLLQHTRDSLTNLIPLGNPNFYSSRGNKKGYN